MFFIPSAPNVRQMISFLIVTKQRQGERGREQEQPSAETKDKIHKHLNTPGGEGDWREKEHRRKERES